MSGPAAIAAAGRTAAPILVVDDNAGKRLSLAAILGAEHELVEVDCGVAALKAVLERTYAVILMDVHMPGMDGYETARLIRMRRESEHTPIIFITADGGDEAQVPIAYASGAVDFMVGTPVAAVLRAKVAIFVELFKKGLELEHSLAEVTTLSERFRDSEARSRAVLHNVADGIVTLHDDGTIASFNNAATRLFGFDEADALGLRFSTMCPEPEQATALADRRPGEVLLATGRRRDGATFPVEQTTSHVDLGSRTVHIVCLRDVSERVAHTEALQHQALHDALTGLPNRVLFRERVSHAIRRAERTQEEMALFLVDLDAFKQVNDTLGHQNGDLLLRLVAERVMGCLRDGDTVARIGGDEFAILPIAPTGVAGAAQIAWRVLAALEEPFLVGGATVDLRASIGIAVVPEHGNNIDDLMRRADLAMYDAKRHRSGCAIFADAQEEEPARRLKLLGELRHCVERDELVLHYQPKVDLKTGEATGLEALVRWNHPSGRLFRPDEFMPEVEGSELMVPLTAWVIDEALSELRRLRDRGYDLGMAVNLGARCLAPDAGTLESVERMTESWGIPAEKLTLELTESAFIDTELPELLTRLRGMAQHISIDDFGTGYSSLVYLSRLPVVEIKADRSFVMTMATVKSDAVIVRSTVDLAHNLSVKVVAEGVEDAETMRMLIDYGCDEAQGYHFARPMPADELLGWLETSPFGLPRRLPVSGAVPEPADVGRA